MNPLNIWLSDADLKELNRGGSLCWIEGDLVIMVSPPESLRDVEDFIKTVRVQTEALKGSYAIKKMSVL